MYREVKIDPIEFAVLLKCEIVQKTNQHIRVKAEGYISDLEDVLYRDWKKEEVLISAIDENGERKRVFSGVMDVMTVEEAGDLRKLYLEAVSCTALLDQKKRVRIFQKQKQRFLELVDFITKVNSGSSYMFMENENRQTEGLLVQYQETDWEFLLRLASCLNTIIIPDCSNNRANFYFGFPKRGRELLEGTSRCRVRENIDEWKRKKQAGLENLGLQDTTDYFTSSSQYLGLCTPVEFQGKKLRIAEVISRWENGEMVHEYRLRTDKGLQTIPYDNPRISGMSMKGRVTGVKEAKVRIKLENTDKGIEESSIWHDFATVYAAGGAAGWYCMPEEGDQIRLYFPDAHEPHGFVLSAVHMGDQRGWELRPEEKYIRTVDDKELRLTPEEILITNHKGMSVALNDKDGISIISDKNIQIKSAEGISLTGGETVVVKGKAGVFLKQNRNMIAVRDGIMEKADKVEHR